MRLLALCMADTRLPNGACRDTRKIFSQMLAREHVAFKALVNRDAKQFSIAGVNFKLHVRIDNLVAFSRMSQNEFEPTAVM